MNYDSIQCAYLKRGVNPGDGLVWMAGLPVLLPESGTCPDEERMPPRDVAEVAVLTMVTANMDSYNPPQNPMNIEAPIYNGPSRLSPNWHDFSVVSSVGYSFSVSRQHGDEDTYLITTDGHYDEDNAGIYPVSISEMRTRTEEL